jgi:hypothetical protein
MNSENLTGVAGWLVWLERRRRGHAGTGQAERHWGRTPGNPGRTGLPGEAFELDAGGGGGGRDRDEPGYGAAFTSATWRGRHPGGRERSGAGRGGAALVTGAFWRGRSAHRSRPVRAPRSRPVRAPRSRPASAGVQLFGGEPAGLEVLAQFGDGPVTVGVGDPRGSSARELSSG